MVSLTPAGRLVLVVDDDSEVRHLTAAVLSCHGYEVAEAQHGRDAINWLEHHAADLIVLDLNMPIMDGWQFRAEQQQLEDQRLATIPILLVTGADGAADHATTLQAAGLITKPFNPEHLLLATAAALRR
jgi:CheY-like chemotaxis protein